MNTIFFDIDTQYDFIMPDGNLHVPGAEKLLPNFEKLMQIARQYHIPIVASVDAHEYDDPEFAIFPPHCIKGEHGWEKVPETSHPENEHIENSPSIHNGPPKVPQIVIEKTSFSMFGNPNTDEILKRLSGTKAIVYGVATDYCVKAAAMGLVERGYDTYVVEDAIAAVSPEKCQEAKAEMKAAGIKFIKTDEVEELVKNQEL